LLALAGLELALGRHLLHVDHFRTGLRRDAEQLPAVNGEGQHGLGWRCWRRRLRHCLGDRFGDGIGHWLVLRFGERGEDGEG
jgi:hypothetical protein